MLGRAAREEFPQRTFHHGAQGAAAWGEALKEDAQELLDMLADQSEQR